MIIFRLDGRQLSLWMWLAFVAVMVLVSVSNPLLLSQANAQTYGTVTVDEQINRQLANNFSAQRNQVQRWIPVLRQPPSGTSAGLGQNVDLWLSSVTWQRSGTDWIQYYLQSDLSLGVSYTSLFTVNLKARDKDAGEQKVPDGWYLMQLAIVLPENPGTETYQSAGVDANLALYDRFVTSRTMLVQVTGGAISQRVTFNFDNLTATTVMSSLYIELTPLQTSCTAPGILNGDHPPTHPCLSLGPDGIPDPRNSEIRPATNFKPYMLEVGFVPDLSSGQMPGAPDSTLQPFGSLGLTEFIIKAKMHKHSGRVNAAKSLTASQFAGQRHLRYLPANDPYLDLIGQYNNLKSGSIQNMIKNMLNTPGMGTLTPSENYRDLYSALCVALYRYNDQFRQTSAHPGWFTVLPDVPSMLRYCTIHPESIMRLARVTHVEQFDAKAAKKKFLKALKFGVQTNFMVSRTRSDDTSAGLNPLTMLFKVTDILGLAVASLSYTLSESNGRATSDSTSGSIATSLDFNLVGMKIPILKSTRCLDVIPTAGHSVFYDSRPESPHRGLHICLDSDTKPYTAGEVYSHIFVHGSDTSIIDIYGPMAQSVNVSLQGDRDISQFYYLARKGLSSDFGTTMQPIDMIEGAQAVFDAMPYADHHVIVNPIAFPKEEAPSFVRKMVGDYREDFPQDH